MSFVYRKPVLSDAKWLWRLVRDSQVLDLNSPYAYLLVSSHFAGTSLVAEADGEPAGFVAAYVPPTKPDTLFIWQVAVAQRWRGRGLGRRMLARAFRRATQRGARFLEATVTPSNQPSLSLFRGFARASDVACREQTAFTQEHFPSGSDHEAELLLRIGPFTEAKMKPEEDVHASV